MRLISFRFPSRKRRVFCIFGGSQLPFQLVYASRKRPLVVKITLPQSGPPLPVLTEGAAIAREGNVINASPKVIFAGRADLR